MPWQVKAAADKEAKLAAFKDLQVGGSRGKTEALGLYLV